MALVLENAKLRRGAEATRCKLQQNWSIGEALGSRAGRAHLLDLLLGGRHHKRRRTKAMKNHYIARKCRPSFSMIGVRTQ